MEKILIVEDNKALAKMLSLHLSKLTGREVLTAHTMAEGVKKANEYKILAALLDLNLPDAPDGEIVDEFTALSIPSIVLTANMDEKTKKIILQKPIIDYVYKEKIKDIDYIAAKIERLAKNRAQKVLIVDDSIVDRSEIKAHLARELFEVFAVANGEEALRFYADNPDISLVITDMHMPRINGIELTTELRKIANKNALSIIGISGDEQTAASFLKFGANDFIKKPFSKEEFACRVNNAIEALENIKQINKMSVTDPLTGIYNRGYFLQKFGEYYAKSNELYEPFALLAFDIDDLKTINDKRGRYAGDEIIKFVANMIKSSSKPVDITARVGDDEFYLLLKSTNSGDAAKVAESIRVEIEKSEFRLKNGEYIKPTVSIGVAYRPLDSAEEMLDSSEAALHKAKIGGKNRVIIG